MVFLGVQKWGNIPNSWMVFLRVPLWMKSHEKWGKTMRKKDGKKGQVEKGDGDGISLKNQRVEDGWSHKVWHLGREDCIRATIWWVRVVHGDMARLTNVNQRCEKSVKSYLFGPTSGWWWISYGKKKLQWAGVRCWGCTWNFEAGRNRLWSGKARWNWRMNKFMLSSCKLQSAVSWNMHQQWYPTQITAGNCWKTSQQDQSTFNPPQSLSLTATIHHSANLERVQCWCAPLCYSPAVWAPWPAPPVASHGVSTGRRPRAGDRRRSKTLGPGRRAMSWEKAIGCWTIRRVGEIAWRCPELGEPQVIMHFNGMFHCKPSMLGFSINGDTQNGWCFACRGRDGMNVVWPSWGSFMMAVGTPMDWWLSIPWYGLDNPSLDHGTHTHTRTHTHTESNARKESDVTLKMIPLLGLGHQNK